MISSSEVSVGEVKAIAFEDNNVPVKFFKNRDLADSYLNSVVKEKDVVLFENDLPDHHP